MPVVHRLTHEYGEVGDRVKTKPSTGTAMELRLLHHEAGAWRLSGVHLERNDVVAAKRDVTQD
jgi:hypothetical protein